MSNKTRQCCLCKKEMNFTFEWNNPEPLRHKDEDGQYSVCCSDCNRNYVIPARKILWPGLSGITEEESKELTSCVQTMSVAEIKDILERDNALEFLRSYCL